SATLSVSPCRDRSRAARRRAARLMSGHQPPSGRLRARRGAPLRLRHKGKGCARIAALRRRRYPRDRAVYLPAIWAAPNANWAALGRTLSSASGPGATADRHISWATDRAGEVWPRSTMSIHVSLNHYTHYRYDRPVALAPHLVRLRPAPHCRTPIESYAL